ncbi:uncharacterized protein LOC128731198 [Anopheles nili]|uniref:uncharacterized protein LOC128731198 n=1 Tax=Anopheles nili TaxID=185578 RepID=UPI00237C1FA5|nr:uncharacterized protein LOC128731198 [Anopheles nili]
MDADKVTVPKDYTIGFIGGGNMAFAIASGLLQKGVVQPDQIYVSATNLEKLEKRWSPLGVTHTTVNNVEVLQNATTIFICIKPQVLPQLCEEFNMKVCPENREAAVHQVAVRTHEKLLVSIMAGVTLNRLQDDLKCLEPTIFVRAMPNTPMQVGVGCIAYCIRPFQNGTPQIKRNCELLKSMFDVLGIAFEVPESQIDAITGLAGCGPAYVYQFIEALADGGVKQGIPRAMALQFAAQTVMGAAKTVLDTGKHPGVLKDEVCSPGGATIHGVHALEQGALRSTVMNAVEKATERARNLS